MSQGKRDYYTVHFFKYLQASTVLEKVMSHVEFVSFSNGLQYKA